VKIKHLLAHTSGIRDQGALLTLAGWRLDDVVTTDGILRLLGRQKDLNFSPGTEFGYSNTGYTLLAEIVARVSGQPFAAFVKTTIFAPLGMNDSQFYDDYQRIVPGRSYAYAKENGVYKKRDLSNSNVGGTGLLTTATDLAKWAVNFDSSKVGDAELVARFNEPSTLADGRAVLYAVIDGEDSYHAKGQFTRNYRGADLLNHTGHTGGFWAYLLRFPGKRLSIIALSNDEHSNIFQTGMTIAGFYLKDDLRPRPATAPRATAAVERRVDIPVLSLKDYEGEFFNDELSATYTVKREGDTLVVSHVRFRTELTAQGKDTFSGRIEFPVDIAFSRDASQVVSGFTISNFGAKNVRFVKVKH
jgi:CubicO group peptidase (beta-lactamase class C family)